MPYKASPLSHRAQVSFDPVVWEKWQNLRTKHGIPGKVLSVTLNEVLSELCDTFEKLERESTIGPVGYGTVFKVLGESLGRILEK